MVSQQSFLSTVGQVVVSWSYQSRVWDHATRMVDLERGQGEGTSFSLSQVANRRVIWSEWIESLELKPSTAVF
jgi:hypothetical protein